MFGNNRNQERFVIVSDSSNIAQQIHIYIVKDRETGVLYTLVDKPQAISIIPLLGADGKPIIEPVE